MVGTATILRGNALELDLDDASVDLVVTSPPYWSLRSYQDGGERYEGQVGSEATPDEYIDSLIAATAEAVRVLRPCGSLWINLGDKYAGHANGSYAHRNASRSRNQTIARSTDRHGVPAKSLIGLPWRYALRCIDDLSLILRAEVICSKPNGLPIRAWCPEGGTVLDPFGGTGTTALVAHALGRHGISVDMSADYCRLAEWRTSDPGELARALGQPKPKPVHEDAISFFDAMGVEL